VFVQEMERMGQRYVCLWTKEQVDAWAATVSG
jgi:hypothetical protein